MTYQQLQALPMQTEALRKQLTAEVSTWRVRAAGHQVLKTTKGVRGLGRSRDPLGRSGHELVLPVLSRKGVVLSKSSWTPQP
ncbi:hypothetical protein ACIBO5_56075 [Nonomuraea angiospora]|uniref:hypothetical protein n=1 Tax=Nonomuraea angiospora TaxID=46172 RepID=UPI0029AED847|nr:hypothetical protein [Nonomuraea angiospora]MDX3104502.1 hypothetical protein [Nonomuraea angiospora]